MPERNCIFCGKTPLTEEHVLPRWLENAHKSILPKGYRIRHKRGGSSYRRPRSDYAWESKRLYTNTTRIVCAKCNNTWMSDIESRAKPFIEPMVQGKVVHLDTESQASIAAWACLRAVIGYHAYDHWQPMPRDWLSSILEHQRPPDSWLVWTTAYDGETATYFESSEIGLVSASEGPYGAEHDHGVVTSMLIGYLALKVFGLSNLTVRRPGRLLRIWPTSLLTQVWPPEIYLDDTAVKQFLDWGHKGM